MKIKKTVGYAFDEYGEYWQVNCPNCDKEYEYKGYFDSTDKTECKCGCIFTTEKVEFEDGSYIY